MRLETFRGAPFVDREEETEFFVDWFNRVPQRILWVYGPKSSGKTTVISYVIDNYLLKKKEKFWVKYFNLRQALITSYDSFLDTFFVEVEEGEGEVSGKIGINVFGFKAEVWERIRRRKLNLFKVFIEELERIREGGKRCVIVVDEIQKLRDVYIENGNGERELLKEFLNLCVSLTKELHLSHVLILTSNTVFIERIYNDARMKETSEFKKIGHLRKEQVEEWLESEGLKAKEIDLVWDYLGGSIPRILKMLENYRNRIDLKDYLEREAWLAYTEIVNFLRKLKDREILEAFKRIGREIVEHGFYRVKVMESEEINYVIESFTEREILFYDPLELKVTGNSRIYEKGIEILLSKI